MLECKLLDVYPFSVAIIQYLCNRYDLPEHWYPRKDIKAQAKVNEYLNWQHANTRMNCAMVFRHLVSRPVKSSMWNHQGSLWLIYSFLHAASNWFLIEKRALLSYDLYFDTKLVIVKLQMHTIIIITLSYQKLTS